MRVTYVSIIVLFSILNLHASSAFLEAGKNTDLFSSLAIVIGLLERYENKMYTGVKVDFGTNGKYYSSFKGNNWWEYFFKKIEVGNTAQDLEHVKGFEKTELSCSTFQFSADRAYSLITKYVQVNPEILKKASSFESEHWENSFVVGIYYSKETDSSYGVSKVSYKSIYEIILVHLLETPNTKIFIYTDDPRFYTFLKVKHPDNVVKYQKNHFELYADQAEHELINCLLLSRTNLFIATPTRFSLTVSQFNPKLPVINFGELSAARTE